jgi:hypothetical protein
MFISELHVAVDHPVVLSTYLVHMVWKMGNATGRAE